MRTNRLLTGFILVAALWFFGVSNVFAHTPVILDELREKDVISIPEPSVSHAFYGHMTGFPHTYEIRTGEPTELFVQILVPDMGSAKDTVSGIIIKEREGGGRVEEIARLTKQGEWESEFEPFGSDSYRAGPSFEGLVEPGVYRIEVSTPDNTEKYVLVVGKKEEFTLGYIELVGRIGDVKEFFGKSRARTIESPLVYVPSLIVIALVVYLMYRRKKTKSPLPG